jgi:hypothetical protein
MNCRFDRISTEPNRFNLTITGIKVRESKRLLYRLITKALPVVGGFTGETSVTAKVEGDVSGRIHSETSGDSGYGANSSCK